LKQGRISLVIGLLFLGGCLVLSDLLAQNEHGTLFNLARESLTIAAGWRCGVRCKPSPRLVAAAIHATIVRKAKRPAGGSDQGAEIRGQRREAKRQSVISEK